MKKKFSEKSRPFWDVTGFLGCQNFRQDSSHGLFFIFHFFHKQKNIIIYLTNIAPSGLKYPN